MDLCDSKASKIDNENTISLINNLNNRVKHLSINHNELVKTLDPVRHSVSQFDE